jgi:putative hydrolase of the HAD superfamily
LAGEGQRIRGIIFDWGGVMTRTAGRDAVLRQYEREMHLAHGGLLEVLFTGQHWWDLSTGKVTSEQYWHEVMALLGGTVPRALESFRDNPFAYERPNQRMVKLVRRVRTGYKTALLSNATLELEQSLAQDGLTGLFDLVVNSSRVGMRKPNPEIFRFTLLRMALPAPACLFIDDKERNTEAAESVGMRSIVFRSAAHLHQQLEALGVMEVLPEAPP